MLNLSSKSKFPALTKIKKNKETVIKPPKRCPVTMIGNSFKLTVKYPKVIPGHVVIDVKSGSINFPDVLMIQGLYQFQPPMPFTPGGESAGVVSEVGEGVSKFKVGDKVFAMTGVGAFAEKILAAEASCMAIPDSCGINSF